MDKHDEAGPLFSIGLPRREDRPERKTVLVRMLPEEKEGLRRLAQKGGLSLSAFCAEILRSVLRQAGDAENSR